MSRTLHGVDIPNNAEVEFSEQRNRTTVTFPGTDVSLGGGLTIYWTTRRWALGYGVTPSLESKSYKGHGWRRKLTKDAVEALTKACHRAGFHIPGESG